MKFGSCSRGDQLKLISQSPFSGSWHMGVWGEETTFGPNLSEGVYSGNVQCNFQFEVGDGFDPENATENVGPTKSSSFFSIRFHWLLSSSTFSNPCLTIKSTGKWCSSPRKVGLIQDFQQNIAPCVLQPNVCLVALWLPLSGVFTQPSTLVDTIMLPSIVPRMRPG